MRSRRSGHRNRNANVGGGFVESGIRPGGRQAAGARDQLTTSIATLINAGILKSGTNAVNAAVIQVRSDVAAATNAAKQDYETEVNAMQSDVEQFQAATENLGNGDEAENLDDAGRAIAAAGIAAEDFLTKPQRPLWRLIPTGTPRP